ncbi:MAG: DEAD/DEAH box helicase [Gammaproteobacteria bacterium]|nr:DEAD/DEAH box helicase [Gammaproteobacteria bacterium]MDE0270061.1 DEAD/DEAH box helicase [Gammaproteobacteria bacterium]
MPNPSAAIPTPGIRVLVRDAEWIVRRVDHAPGGYQITCEGASELVRGREAVFLTALEPPIKALDPAETTLVADRSAQFADSLLYMESQLRQAVPNDGGIHVGHTAAMDVVPYQLEPTRLALGRPRQRILIADAVGLGKTLEAGILVSELIARGRGRRILVLVVKSMLAQFQKEFWSRFTIPLTRLDSVGIQRVRSRIPTNHNPFYYYDKSIISIDTLKQDAEYRTYLEQTRWDIIVIDEAHNVADRGTSSLRSRLAKRLSKCSDTLIMLSATPHDGRARSFASLVNMLDATAIADPDDYTKEDFRPGLVIRRFKKDVQAQVRTAFRDREVHPQRFDASATEEAAYEALLAVPTAGERTTRNRDLFHVTLEKALFSSPAACLETLDERLKRRQQEIGDGEAPDAVAAEMAALKTLRGALEKIAPADYAKYQALLGAIRGGWPFLWTPDTAEDRLVIFTERIATLNWLRTRLAEDLALKRDQIEILHGGLSDIEQQRVVEDFGNAVRPVRLLLCSDVAAEGINLHYQCHRLIHFDMPWSLMVFQQRNGRVDRYGQTATPQIVYLVTQSANPTIRGDTRILEVLMEKDEQAYKNIGDPSVFMDVYDTAEEERITKTAIADGESADAFDRRLQPKSNEGDDLLVLFLQGGGEATEPETPTTPPPPISLFPSDLHYCEAALHRLRTQREQALGGEVPYPGARLRFAADRSAETLTLDAPEDLVARYSHLPPEVLPESRRLVLTTSRSRMAEAIAESRRAEANWPRLHYLWRLSPVVEWLNDRMLTAFGRFEAPVLSGLPGLGADERVFVLSGLVPNLKGHPLMYEWVALSFVAGEFSEPLTFEAIVERTGLGRREIPNREQPPDFDRLNALLPKAVKRARQHFLQRRKAFEDIINAQLNEEVAALDAFKERRLQQLELDITQPAQANPLKRQYRSQASAEVEEVYDEYLTWIQDTMTTEPSPWVKVICAMTP